VNVLLLSKDPALFRTAGGGIGDARRRHACYAARLRERHPGSEIRVIGYAGRTTAHTVDDVAPGLRLWAAFAPARVFYLAGVLLRLRAALAEGWRPDVVSVQTPWEEGVLGLFIAWALGASFVPQLHVDIFSEVWASEHPLNRWRRFVARRVLARGDVVRVVSESLRVRVADACGLPLDRVRVAPVGVNFSAAPRVQVKAHPEVLFVGRLSPEKNLSLWLRVAAAAMRQRPDTRFVIVGEGGERARLEAEARALGIAAKVSFRGAVDHAELPPVYAAADAFLLTSDHEAFGRVVLEAQLAGVPVVSTACSGPQELIADGQTGLLAPVGDASALAMALQRLLADQKLAAAIGERGRASAASRFSLETLTDQLIDTWERARG
jgi:glycosyltransferase involved in cell wall biosynthesis